MKKWYRSNGIKGALILLEHIFLTAAVLAGLLTVYLYDAGITFFDSTEEYGASRSFADQLYYRSRSILNAENAEKNNSLYPPADEREDLLVDLKEVAEGTPITWRNTSGLAYYYRDLRAWLSSYSYCNEEIAECRAEDGRCVYFYLEDFLDKLKNGTFQVSLSDPWRQAYELWKEESAYELPEQQFVEELVNAWGGYEDIEFFISEYGTLSIKDTSTQTAYELAGVYREEGVPFSHFSPAGADNLLEAVNASTEWNGKLSEAYQALELAIAKAEEAAEAADTLRTYEEGNTNLTYLYADLDKKQVFSNNSSYGSFEDYAGNVEEMTKDGYYIVLYPSLAECSANINLDARSLHQWQSMADEACDYGSYVFAVKVDQTFPVMDDLAAYEKMYRRFAGYLMPAVAVGIICAVLFLAGLVWLTVIAGRRAEGEEVHLCWFDRWYTEIAAAAVLTVWGSGAALVWDVLVHYSSDLIIFLAAGGLSLYTVCLFLVGYLSLVRRIKAGNLWKDSVCRLTLTMCVKLRKKCLNLLRSMMRFTAGICRMVNANLRVTVKTMLIFGAFLLAQFLLLLEPEWLILLMAADGCAALYLLRRGWGSETILHGLKKITDGDLQYKIPLDYLKGEQKTIAEYINRIGDGLDAAVEDSLRSERMKTELITNVSHDIKTPLTSIINYVDLLKRENFTDPKICGYLDVLEAKAQRLKVLTEDVVEASKASTGNISLDIKELNFVEMVQQAAGEFQEKYQSRSLTLLVSVPLDPVIIRADGQRMWRVLENIFNNVMKYAMEGTRVYAAVDKQDVSMEFSLKNISAQPLNISPDELTERFIRGDLSRNTEGSGLGLSIARSLTELQGGAFNLYVDGDLFKVVITFSLAGAKTEETQNREKERAEEKKTGGKESSPEGSVRTEVPDAEKMEDSVEGTKKVPEEREGGF